MSADAEVVAFSEPDTPPVRGFLHRPRNPTGAALVLSHSASGNSRSPLLVEVANGFAEAGITVLRCDLPFRQARPQGPPVFGSPKEDQQGLRNAVGAMRKLAAARVFLGGHSYGGRQGTILAASSPGLVDGLLLLSYPLHPPRKLTELRTGHFPKLQTPALFVHGTRDPFGSPEEMEAALALIPARTMLLPIAGAGHDLGNKQARSPELAPAVVSTFRKFFAPSGRG